MGGPRPAPDRLRRQPRCALRSSRPVRAAPARRAGRDGEGCVARHRSPERRPIPSGRRSRSASRICSTAVAGFDVHDLWGNGTHRFTVHRTAAAVAPAWRWDSKALRVRPPRGTVLAHDVIGGREPVARPACGVRRPRPFAFAPSGGRLAIADAPGICALVDTTGHGRRNALRPLAGSALRSPGSAQPAPRGRRQHRVAVVLTAERGGGPTARPPPGRRARSLAGRPADRARTRSQAADVRRVADAARLHSARISRPTGSAPADLAAPGRCSGARERAICASSRPRTAPMMTVVP